MSNLENPNKIKKISKLETENHIDDKDPRAPLFKIIEENKNNIEEIIVPDFIPTNITIDDVFRGVDFGKEIVLINGVIKRNFVDSSSDGRMRDYHYSKTYPYIEYDDEIRISKLPEKSSKSQLSHFFDIFEKFNIDIEEKKKELENLILERTQKNIEIAKEQDLSRFDYLLEHKNIIPKPDELYPGASCGNYNAFIERLESFKEYFFDIVDEERNLSKYQLDEIEKISISTPEFHDTFTNSFNSLRSKYSDWEGFWKGSLPKLLEMHDNKEILFDFGGSIRRTGSNNRDYWVLDKEGNEIPAQRVVSRKINHKKFPLVKKGQVALHWWKSTAASEHGFEINFGTPNEAQAKVMEEIQVALDKEWEGRKGFSSGEESPSIGDGWFAELSDEEWEKISHVFETDEQKEEKRKKQEKESAQEELSFEEKLNLLKGRYE